MSREKNWQVPGRGAIYELPQWVEENAAFVEAKDKILLHDGSIARPGDWLVLKNGKLEKSK